MFDKNWYEEVKEDFEKNIKDSYTLNLAVSVLEDRKELLDENKELKLKLQQRENVIKETKEYIEQEDLYEVDFNLHDANDKYAKKDLLEILGRIENE